jgi:hypothetical protein
MFKKAMAALEDLEKVEDMTNRVRLERLFDEETLGPEDERVSF